MKKKILLIILTVAMLIPCISAFAISSSAAVISSHGKTPFEDVPASSWYKEYADFCYANGIVTGQGNTYTFAPDAKLTRATFVVMLARALKVDVNWYTWSTFSDCPKGTWYTPSVMWASENGYVNGTGNGKFSPNAVMTREQAAVMFARILQKKGYAEKGGNAYLYDLKGASAWALKDIKYVINYGLMSSTKTNEYIFSAQTAMTRAQICKMFKSFLVSYSDCKHSSKTTASCTQGVECKSCGLKLSLPNGHSCSSLSCVRSGYCNTCGAYVGPDSSLHSFTKATCTKPQTCTVCGATRGEKAAHNFKAATCTEPKTCVVCNYKTGSALGHTTKFGICTRCNGEVFASDYYRLAYYMARKGESYGTGEYAYYADNTNEAVYIVYDANDASFIINYIYAFYDGRATYITVYIPSFDDSYELYIDHYDSSGNLIFGGSGYLYYDDYEGVYGYNVNYSRDKSYSTSYCETEQDRIFDMFSFTDIELIKFCGTGMSAFGF